MTIKSSQTLVFEALKEIKTISAEKALAPNIVGNANAENNLRKSFLFNTKLLLFGFVLF